MNHVKYCPHCNKEYDVHTVFCTKCGRKLEDKISTGNETPPQNNQTAIVSLIVVVLAALLGIFYFSTPSSKDKESFDHITLNNDSSQDTPDIPDTDTDYSNTGDFVDTDYPGAGGFEDPDVGVDEEYDIPEVACFSARNKNDSYYIPGDGKSFFFGTYEQDGDCSNGSEPIEWLTINVDTGVHAGETLLISRYVLDYVPYDTKNGTAWADSDLREWLNSTFYSRAFDKEEKSRILVVTNENTPESVTCANGKKASTVGSSSTGERIAIFRPSALNLYSNMGLFKLEALGTPYAWQQYKQDPSGYYSYRAMGYATRGMYLQGPYVNEYGEYSVSSSKAGVFGVRPMMFIR